MTNNAPCKFNKADPNYPFRSYRNDIGEIVYSVPLECPEDQTLDEPLGREEEHTCILLRFKGGKPMRVHFIESTNKTAAYEQCAWLNTLHTRERRYSERFQLLPDSTDTKPGECVWDYSPKMRRNDDGYTLTDYSDIPEHIESCIIEKFRTNELYLKVYRLHVKGFKPKEIGECLGIDQAMVYFYQKETLRIAQEYRKACFDEGQYVFPDPETRCRKKREQSQEQSGKRGEKE